MTIHINRYGEQHLDILSLIIIWIICLVGLIVLQHILTEEKTKEMMTNEGRENTSMATEDKCTGIIRVSDIDSKPKEVIGILAKPLDDINLQMYQQDD